jgi:hypothetical protein
MDMGMGMCGRGGRNGSRRYAFGFFRVLMLLFFLAPMSARAFMPMPMAAAAVVAAGGASISSGGGGGVVSIVVVMCLVNAGGMRHNPYPSSRIVPPQHFEWRRSICR